MIDTTKAGMADLPPPAFPEQFYCNKCGKFPPQALHAGCEYLAVTDGSGPKFSADQMRANAAVVPDNSVLENHKRELRLVRFHLTRGDFKGRGGLESQAVRAISKTLGEDDSVADYVPTAKLDVPTAKAQHVAAEKLKEMGFEWDEEGELWSHVHPAAPSAPVLAEPQQPVQGGGDASELLRLAEILRDCGRLVDSEGKAEAILRSAALALPPAQPVQPANEKLREEAGGIAYMLRDEGDKQSADVIDALIERLDAAPPSPVAQPEALPVQGDDLRDLSKWLNEECTAPINRHALARVLARASLPTSGAPALTRDQIIATMQSCWDDHIQDTGCYPGDFEVVLRKRLMFTAGSWAGFVADCIISRLAAPQPAAARVGLSGTTSHEVLKVAVALEQRRILEEIKAVAALQTVDDMPTPYQAAWHGACEEIFFLATDRQWHMDEDSSRFTREAAHGIASPQEDGGTHA